MGRVIRQQICSRPDCGRVVLNNNNLGLCDKCFSIFQIVIWILNNITRPKEEEIKKEENV